MVESLVGLNVKDHEMYQKYREGMTPILAKMGGGFRYDFIVEKTLRGEADHEINRLFIIYFPNAEIRDKFFSNEDYKEVRTKYFDPAVLNTTKLAEYEL